jgi:small multidrug resistance pump
MRDSTFAWLVLAASVLAEVAGTMALRHSDGFTRLIPSLITGLCYTAAIWLMAVSVRNLEVGLAMPWAGSGTAVTALLGIILFGESASLLRSLWLGLIISGVVVLNLSAQYFA